MRWATEHETGKRLGKKGLGEVADIVMQMIPQQEVKPIATNWREKVKHAEAVKLSVDLSKLIGRQP